MGASVPLFMTLLSPEPGSIAPERIREIAAAGQRDPVVRGYRSFHSLSEGRIVWLLEAPDRKAVEDWFARMDLPLDAITELEMEGFVGNIRPTRHTVPNCLPGTIVSDLTDGTLALVRLRLDATGAIVTALCDSDEWRSLSLGPGAPVLALFRATNVSLAPDTPEFHAMKLSFPNQIAGKVTNIIYGPTLVIVHLDTPAGQIVSAIIPSAAESIDLKIGDEVTALFKALDVSLAKA